MTGSSVKGTIDASISLARLGPDLPEALDRRADAMARLDVLHGVLVADRRGQRWHSDAVNIDPSTVEEAIARHDGTFFGAIGIDPFDGVAALGYLRQAVDNGFVAAHTVPHAFGLPPDDQHWYPTYAACEELGIPVQVELGVHRSPGTRLRSVGRPITLDTVACDFPELRLVALGPWPWTEEAISVAYKHTHINLAIGGDDPGAGAASLARFADSWGRGSVLFASQGAPLDRAMSTIEEFGLRAESRQSCLTDVPNELFELGAR